MGFEAWDWIDENRVGNHLKFEKSSPVQAPAGEVFAWHQQPGAFERLTPPWSRIEVIERPSRIENGSRVVIRMKVGPVWRRWVAEYCDFEQGRQFADVQPEGPFAYWRHLHRFSADGETASRLKDLIEYELPLGALGRALAGRHARRELEREFRYRHAVTVGDLEMLERHRRAGAGPMHVLVSGSSGLIGSQLVHMLSCGGHRVTRLVRRPPRPGQAEVRLSAESGGFEGGGLEGLDAVVHLAGENVVAGFWNAGLKQRIRDSRVEGTRRLCEALAGLDPPPRALVCASALGYYGDRGDEELEERSGPGESFLADVCRQWEAATEPAREAGMRVVKLRVGVVLSPAGGALVKMLTPFWLGLGGRLGHGRQWMSWIALDDALDVIYHALMDEQLEGPVNAVTPHPVTNAEFTKTLGRVLRRPTIFPAPAFALRLAVGELADELLLTSARVVPRRLTDRGHSFRYPQLEDALRHVLGR